MKKVSVNRLVQASHAMGIVMGMREVLDAPPNSVRSAVLAQEVRKHCLDKLRALQQELQVLRAVTTKRAADRFVLALQGADDVYYLDAERMSQEISSRLADELAGRSVFVLDEHEALVFNDPGFGADVAAKFSTARYDIEEAGKCLALGRSTAAVFHLMRALEFALRAVHASLGIPAPTTANAWNWGTIANGIRDEIKRRGAPFKEAKAFDEFYVLLDGVRTAWRNETMHAGDQKTLEEATAIHAAVKSFMRRVAARMDERGQPLA